MENKNTLNQNLDTDLFDKTMRDMTIAIVSTEDEHEKELLKHLQRCLVKLKARTEENIKTYTSLEGTDDKRLMSYPGFEADTFAFTSELLAGHLDSHILHAKIFERDDMHDKNLKKDLVRWKTVCEYLCTFNRYILRTDDINYLLTKTADSKHVTALSDARVLASNAVALAKHGDFKGADDNMLMVCVHLEEVSEDTGFDFITRMENDVWEELID